MLLIFGLGADDAMQFVKNETDALGITHTYYEHYYKNTKIDIGHNTVHSRNGKAHLVNGKICIGLNMSVTPAITAASAINYAKNYVNATTYLWEDSIAEQNLRVQKNDVTATYYPNPELLITMIGADLAFVPSNFKLAYKVDIHSKVPYNVKAIYVDANTGNIIKEASLIHTGAPLTVSPNSCAPTLANTMYSGSQVIPAYYTTNPAHGNTLEYRLENPCKGGGIQTNLTSVSPIGDFYTTTSSSWGTGPTIEQLTQLHWATDKYYDFLLQTFNRQSYDNNNGKMLSYVSTMGPQFSGSAIEIPVGSGTNDMIGHEWGHGITQYDMAGGNGTLGEPGAISEGISDVFGATFEFYLEGTNGDWLIGEDNPANIYVRDMSNPLSKNMPDTYNGNLYANAGRHGQGQVLGYWFYLLSMGGSGTNSSPEPNTSNTPHSYNISGIGLSQATQILYRAYPYLTSSSKYHDLRNATIQASIDLYGNNCNTSNKVKNAWDAVGVYDQGNIFLGIQSNCIEACVAKTDITCTNAFGSANIFIDPVLTDPYSIDWLKSDFSFSYGNSLSVNNLPVGDYVVNVVNLNNTNCSSFFYFTIYDYSNTTLAFTTTNATCTDGTASVIASGGAYPYTYAWNPSYFNEATAMISDLPAGTYNVTVTDANGCVKTGNTVVAQNPISFYKPFNYAVTTNETWNQSLIKIDGQVIVAPGGHLTITGNTRVEFSHHADQYDVMPYGVARLIVLPGGNLTIDPNVTLIGCGGGTWDGIELWGTGIFNNGYSNATIKGKIENANVGISTTGTAKINQGIVNNNGGAFTAVGAQFVNNKTAINIPQNLINYPYNVSQCSFSFNGTSYYKDDYNAVNGRIPLHIFAGQNINLTASSNNITGGDQYYASNLKGTGIKCIDCNLTVNSASGPTSTFTGLTKGVDAEYGYTTNQVKINNVLFNNNQETVYLQGSLLGEIKNNIFNIPSPVAPITKSYGLFAVNSNGFDISGNTINPLVADSNTYGMVIENSGATGGVVFNNTYNGVGVGLQAQKNNSNLKIGCNNFNNPVKHSIAVVNIGANISSLKWQGKFNFGSPDCSQSNYPAGNEWNYSGCSGTNKNIFTDAGVAFKYESHNNLNTQPSCLDLLWYWAYVDPNICQATAKTSSSCNSIFPLPPAPPTTSYHNYYIAIRDLIQQNKILIDTLKPRYRAAKQAEDGGNTQHLLNFINNPAKSTAQVKNKLMASGALSDEVLVTAIERKPVALSAAALQEILATQVPLSMKVLNTVQYSAVLKDIKDQIFAANANPATYVKAKDLEGEIANLKGDNLLLKSELQRTKLKQGKTINRGDISNDPSERMLLSRDYATSNQPDSVRVILNQLQNDSTLDVVEKQNFISYMDAIADMLDSYLTIYTVDSLIINNMQPVATTHTEVSANANVVLKERQQVHHQYFIADVVTSNNQRLMNSNKEEIINTELANNGTFKVFPNPNTGSFKILFDETRQSEALITVTIYNLLGQVFYSKTYDKSSPSQIEVDSEKLTKGLYIITLIQNNNTIGQCKLIIE